MLPAISATHLMCNAGRIAAIAVTVTGTVADCIAELSLRPTSITRHSVAVHRCTLGKQSEQTEETIHFKVSSITLKNANI